MVLPFYQIHALTCQVAVNIYFKTWNLLKELVRTNPTQIVSSLKLFTKLANILQHCGHAGNIPALNVIFEFLTKKL